MEYNVSLKLKFKVWKCEGVEMCESGNVLQFEQFKVLECKSVCLESLIVLKYELLPV